MKSNSDIKLKRIFEEAQASDGHRILVDRLWPRGISKKDADLDEWLKECVPSTELRKWFDHDEEQWEDFIERYKKELRNKGKQVAHLKTIYTTHEIITFLYAAKNEKCNNAVALRMMLMEEMI